MSTVTSIRPVTATAVLAGVTGYVEAMTADRLLGWAWTPAKPDARATIELRIGDTVIASAVADLPRADLASNGIGDGRHAYNIEIPEAFRGRTAELLVFARAGEGEAVAIGAPPAAEGLADQVTKLLRGVDMVLNSQRLIHRNLQAALVESKQAGEPPVSAALAQMADLQAGTAAQLAAIEGFVVRLDEHLSRLAPEDAKPADTVKQFPPASLWALGVASVALVVSVVGLVRSLGG